MQTVRNKIFNRIQRFTPGRAFVAGDFLDIASRGSIDMALSALLRDNVIRRVRRGLYDVPKVNPDLGGTLSPDIDHMIFGEPPPFDRIVETLAGLEKDLNGLRGE